MYFRTSRYFPAALCVAALALAACSTDGPTTPAVGQVRVTVSTTGPDMDPDGYTLTLDDTATAVVQSNGVATFPSVRAGQHSVAMSGLAVNCSAAAVPSVDVAPGATADVNASVTCVQLVGALRVTAPTTGVDPDVAYLLYLDQDAPRLLLANDTLAFPNLISGNHSLRIAGIAPNCALAASATQTASVTFGTTNVARFDVACTARVPLVLFSSTRGDTVDPYKSTNDLYTMTSTGANVVRLTTQAAALHGAWSPDGKKIAYHAVSANGRFDIHVMNADGTNDVQLTTDPQDDIYAQWSPDGTQIAFERSAPGTTTRAVWVMNADGSGQHAVKQGNAGHPAWSPDGSRIVFDGVIASNTWDIYTVRPDGTDLVQLTHSTTFATFPHWSPDGRRILFICHDGAASTDLFVMAADGSGAVNLTQDPNGNFSEDQSWSPDGQWISFRSNRKGGNVGIYVMKADGTGVTDITQSLWNDSGSDWHP